MATRKKKSPDEEQAPLENFGVAPDKAEAPLPPESRISDLEEEIAVYKEKYLRLLAEYDNYRKRSQKEKDLTCLNVKAATITEFLPVYDNLERAASQDTEDAAYKKGVEMTLNQFELSLKKLGVSIIPALGQKFDPELHSAMMHVEDENEGSGVIVEEFQKGFKLGDKVIRFSLVKVAN